MEAHPQDMNVQLRFANFYTTITGKPARDNWTDIETAIYGQFGNRILDLINTFDYPQNTIYAQGFFAIAHNELHIENELQDIVAITTTMLNVLGHHNGASHIHNQLAQEINDTFSGLRVQFPLWIDLRSVNSGNSDADNEECVHEVREANSVETEDEQFDDADETTRGATSKHNWMDQFIDWDG